MISFQAENRNILLGALAVVLFILGIIANDPFGFFTYSRQKAEALLPFKNRSEINSIRISKAGESALQLNRQDSQWTIQKEGSSESYPAGSAKIDESLEKWLLTKRFQSISSDSSKYEEYGVSEKGLTLTFKSSRGDFSIIIGNQGSTFNTTLVRLADESTVYSVRGNFTAEWPLSIDHLRDKKMFLFTPENIKAVQFRGAQNYRLEQQEGAWQIIHKNKTSMANPQKVEQLLKSLAQLKSLEFYTQKLPRKDYLKVSIELKTQTSEVLTIKKGGDTLFMGYSVQNPYWQSIRAYDVNALVKAPDEFISTQQPPNQ